MKRLFFIGLVLLYSTSAAQMNMNMNLFDDDSTEVDCSYSSFDLGYNNCGISFGNSPIWNGVRFNFSDCGVKEINGINITIWKPEENPLSKVRGISFGLAPFASELQGVSIGILASVAEKEIQGISIGGLAVVSGGDADGINIGGLALVTQGNMTGINFGGLACVAQKDLIGINTGGLALVSEKNMTGLNIGGLACVTQGEMKGINFGGLALVSEGDLYGLNQALLAIVSKNTIKGINAVGYKTEAAEFDGFNLTVCWTKVEIMKGVSISAYNKITDTQHGLVIGIFNVAENLNGVQIGLLNIAKNNSGITKVLPFFNAHFD
jgi:hypothetical protein